MLIYMEPTIMIMFEIQPEIIDIILRTGDHKQTKNGIKYTKLQ